MKYLFIVNPVAGRGDGLEKWDQVKTTALKAGLNFDAVFTEAPGHAVSLAKEGMQKGYDTVVACGGDGTINEVVRGIHEYGVRRQVNLGIVPCGTGNDLVRALNIPLNIEKAVEILKNARVQNLDIGMIEGKYFMNVVGIGFDGAVANEINKNVKKLKGTAAYLYAVFKVLMQYRSPEMVINIDGEILKGRYFLVAIGNGQYYGGGMKILPTAVPADGLLEVCVVRDVPAIEVIRMLPSIFKGNHIGHRAVKIYRGKRITVESKEEVIVQADGELLGALPMTFDLEAGAFPVLVP